MTKKEFSRALAIAQTSSVKLWPDHVDGSLLGFGLPDFEPVTTTLMAVAELIRWQAKFFYGGWDHDAIQAIWHFGRTRFTIAGAGADDVLSLPMEVFNEVFHEPVIH